MAAVEAFGQPEDGRQRSDRFPALFLQIPELLVPALRRGLAMIPGNQRDDLDFVGLEPAEVAVFDEVVRVLVVAFVADVDADVVQQRRVFEPLALAICEAVDAARLVEQLRREACHLLRVLRPVVAAFGELEHAAAPDVGVAVGLNDLFPVARDVLEDQAFPQRQIAEGDVVRAEPPHDRIEQDAAGDGEVGAPRLEPRDFQPLLQVARDERLARPADLLGRDAAVAQAGVRRPVADDDAADALDGARRADDAIEALLRDLSEKPAHFLVDVARQLAFFARRQRIALHVALGETDDAELETLAQLHRRPGAARDLDAAAADVNYDRDVARDADAVRRGLMNETRFFGAGDDARADAGVLGDLLEEIGAVLRLARRAGGDGDDLVDAVAVGEPLELRHHLQRRVHRFGRERLAVEAARAEAHHFFFAIDDFEGEIGAHAHDDHVQRVGADVDRGEPHAPFTIMGGARRSALIGGVITIMSASRRRYDLLEKRLGQFTRMLPELGEGELLAMHRTRVASRRLREILPILELEPGMAQRLGRRLKTVTVELGIVRELGVLIRITNQMHDAGHCDAQMLRRISSALTEAYSQARDRLDERLPVSEVERIAKKLAKIGRGLRDRKPSRGWMWAIEARVNRRASALLSALDAAGSIYLQERLHDVRIALKKFRYALEISCEAAGLKPAADIRTAKKYQDTLGRMHDLQVLIDRIREYQPSIAQPDLAMWRKIDALVNTLEDECRRLHAKFLRQQPGIREVAERATRAAAAAPRARRAIAS